MEVKLFFLSISQSYTVVIIIWLTNV